MPDGTSLPVPTSPWADRIARLKILRRKARSEQRRQRRYSKERLLEAEHLLAEVIDRGDLIAEVVTTSETRLGRRQHVSEICLLVSLDPRTFECLCAFDAEAADLEDSHDAEDEVDEPSLASTGAVNQNKWSDGHPYGMQPVDAELDKADDEPSGDEIEPSLGALNGWGASDQRDWAGSDRTDREHDGDDLEPDADGEPDERRWARHIQPLGPVPQPATEQAEPVTDAVEEARSRFQEAAGCKVVAAPALDPDGKPGAWLLLKRAGGQK